MGLWLVVQTTLPPQKGVLSGEGGELSWFEVVVGKIERGWCFVFVISYGFALFHFGCVRIFLKNGKNSPKNAK